MDIDKTNTWLSLMANAGVLLGIVIVIFELNQGNQAIENEAYWSRASAGLETQRLIIESDIVPLIGKYSDLDFEALSAMLDGPERSEVIRVQAFYRWMTIYWQTRFFTQPTAGAREALSQAIMRNLNTSRLAQSIYTSDFILLELDPQFRSYLTAIKER